MLLKHYTREKNFLHSAAWYYTDAQAATFCELLKNAVYVKQSNTYREIQLLRKLGVPKLKLSSSGELNVVDLGPGDGTKFTRLLSTLDFNTLWYFPVDISQYMIKTTLAKLQKALPGHVVSSAECDIENIAQFLVGVSDETVDGYRDGLLRALKKVRKELQSLKQYVRSEVPWFFERYESQFDELSGRAVRNTRILEDSDLRKFKIILYHQLFQGGLLADWSKEQILDGGLEDNLSIDREQFTETLKAHPNAKVEVEYFTNEEAYEERDSGVQYFWDDGGVDLEVEVFPKNSSFSLEERLVTVLNNFATFDISQALTLIPAKKKKFPGKGFVYTGRDGILADFFSIPDIMNSLDVVILGSQTPTLVMLLGQTLGNFPKSDRAELLQQIAQSLSSRDYFLVGVEYEHAPTSNLVAPYTSASAQHFLFTTAEMLGIPKEKLFLQSEYRDHAVNINFCLRENLSLETDIGSVDFFAEQPIPVAYSYKFSRAELQHELNEAGFKILSHREYTEKRKPVYALVLAQRRKSADNE